MMLNYYDLCNLSPSASKEEVKKAIYQQMRLWSHRTNAPQIERRQEAERMVRLLEEAEEILLDDAKRKEYDVQLRKAIGILVSNMNETSVSPPVSNETSQEELTATTEKEKTEDSETVDEMIEQVRQLVSMEKNEEALLLAEKITQNVKNSAEVWLLVGRCRVRLGKYEDAISPYVKACDLEPKNATYVYELGEVFEKLENQTRALEQFKRASLLNPDDLRYKFKVGTLLIQMDQVQEGLSLLEQCFRASPKNSEYQIELARAYEKLAFSKWKTIQYDHPYLPPGQYPMSKADLSMAESYINRAIRIPIQDPELRKDLQQKKSEIYKRKGRQFTGSWIMAILSFLFLVVTQMVNPSIYNFILISLPIFYLLSAWTPKYRIYQKAFENKSPKTDFAYLFFQLKDRFGTAGAWLIGTILTIGYFFITAFILSIVIIHNFIRNFF